MELAEVPLGDTDADDAIDEKVGRPGQAGEDTVVVKDTVTVAKTVGGLANGVGHDLFGPVQEPAGGRGPALPQAVAVDAGQPQGHVADFDDRLAIRQ